MIRKKAISHVEVMVSFLIFIVFLIFLLSYLNPFQKSGIEEGLVSLLERELISNSQIEVLTSTLIINKTYPLSGINCFIVEQISQNPVTVKNTKGEIANATNTDALYIEEKGRLYNIFSSPVFKENKLDYYSCASLDSGSYNFGVTKKESFVFLDNVNEIAEEYEQDYDYLKQELNFPGKNDFSFSLKTLNNTELVAVTRNEPIGVGIVARDINVGLIDKQGNIYSAILNIKVW